MKIVFIAQDFQDLVEEWYDELASMEELTTTWMVANKGIIQNKVFFFRFGNQNLCLQAVYVENKG